MKYKPVGDKILVELKEKVKKVGNISLPERAQKQEPEGKILALGDFESRNPDGSCNEFSVKVGQHVVLDKRAGFQIPDTDLVLITEDKILAVVLPD